MPVTVKNRLVFHKVTGIVLLTLLAGCESSGSSPNAGNDNLIRIAEQLHAKGDDAGAAQFYTRALQRSPEDIRVRKEFGEVLEAHGDFNGAAEQYRIALKIPSVENVQYRDGQDIASDDADLLRAYGRVLIRLNQPALARPVYARAVEIDPDDVRSLNGLGVSLDEINQHEAAQKIYRDALDDKPGDFVTLANLGHSYVLSGAYDEAIKLLEPHINDPGVTPALRQNLAEAYGMAGMDADAERVSRLDLTPEQVKHNMAFYRSRRTHLSPAAALIADLGSFPTEEIAAAHAEDIKAKFPDETEGLTVAATPVVSTIGGLPSFAVRVTGFEKTSTLRAFCSKLKQQKIACVSRMDL